MGLKGFGVQGLGLRVGFKAWGVSFVTQVGSELRGVANVGARTTRKGLSEVLRYTVSHENYVCFLGG